MKAENRYSNINFPNILNEVDYNLSELKSYEAKNAYLKLIIAKARTHLRKASNNEEDEKIKLELQRLNTLKCMMRQETYTI